MGDRYTMNLRCDWCGEENDDVWYAESSGVTEFKCGFCLKPNEIVPSFESKKVEEKKR